MIARITDWKPTIVGLLIALVIVAALLTRPEWGAAEIATLAGGVASALLGAWARSSAPTAASSGTPTVPTVPPAVGGLLLALALVGCARPLDVAIASANVGRDVGLAAHDAIESACVPAYKAAQDKAAIAAVDAKCQPAEKAYRAYVAAHTTAVLVIQRAQLGLATEADALAAARAVGQVGASLASSVQAVTR